MSNKLSIKDTLKEINPKKEAKRFNKKDFNSLLTAVMNDPDFTSTVARGKAGGMDIKEIMPTKEFRKWCKKLLEKVGMDSKEASIVMGKDFQFDNMDGIYEFFTEALYLYLDNGNKFDFLPKKDFKATLSLKKVKKSSSTSDVFSPKDRKFLGTYEVTKEEHKVLKSSSSCPSYLKNRRKIK